VPASRALERPRCGRCKHAVSLDAPIPVESAADFDEIVRGAPVPVVVDFWAEWCAPCRMVAPELEELARSRAGRVLVAKVDTEAVPDLAARYGIQSLPTFVVFDRGKESNRASGAMRATQLATALGL
jgi:thioredoxin 2